MRGIELKVSVAAGKERCPNYRKGRFDFTRVATDIATFSSSIAEIL